MMLAHRIVDLIGLARILASPADSLIVLAPRTTVSSGMVGMELHKSTLHSARRSASPKLDRLVYQTK